MPHARGARQASAARAVPLELVRRASGSSLVAGWRLGGSNESLVKTQRGPGLELIEVPVPKVLGDVLVKVKATGICGTDLHIDSWDEWARDSAATCDGWP